MSNTTPTAAEVYRIVADAKLTSAQKIAALKGLANGRALRARTRLASTR